MTRAKLIQGIFMSVKDASRRGFRRLIPSMNAIIEFEAVARLGSFTMAASELGVTQAAVSRQIRKLEDGLGVRLFHRLHRSIALTAEGKTLFPTVTASLQRIAGVLDSVSSGTEEHELVLAATAAFSHLRLLPKLADLRRAMPHLNLRLRTQMISSDLRHEEVDVAVRYGDGKWPDGTSTLLFDEEVFPICSPAWLASNEAPRDLFELAVAPLIDSEATSEGWMTWEEWFRAQGGVPSKLRFAFRCSLYPDALEAVRSGQGVTLGWLRMIEDQLASGELVRLTDLSLKVTQAYFAVVPHGRAPSPATRTLIDWLRGDVRHLREPPP